MMTPATKSERLGRASVNLCIIGFIMFQLAIWGIDVQAPIPVLNSVAITNNGDFSIFGNLAFVLEAIALIAGIRGFKSKHGKAGIVLSSLLMTPIIFATAIFPDH